MEKYISIKNASHHNLKNVSVDIPRNKITLITGVSGSGKSTLAFDTLYAEGQRRFVESLSSYARQFLERMTKPEVESIAGLLPAVAIEQKPPPRNPRSTIGTVTEIYDYIRALYARIGRTICAKCGREIIVDNPTSIAERITGTIPQQRKRKKNIPINNPQINQNPNTPWPLNAKLYIMIEMFPPGDIQPGKIDAIQTFAQKIERLTKFGFSRVVAGNSNEITELDDLRVTHNSNLTEYYILVDRWIISTEPNDISRLIDSLEVAFSANTGRIIVRNIDSGYEERFSNTYECASCHIKYEEPHQKTFAFNTPQGACPECHGAGHVFGISESLVVPDQQLSLAEHCIEPYRTSATASVFAAMVEACDKYNVPTNIPYKNLTQDQKDIIWNGKGMYFGLIKYFKHIETKAHIIKNRMILSRYRGATNCRVCGGSRLKFAARQVFVGGKNIPELINMPLTEFHNFCLNLELTDFERQATDLITNELIARTKVLIDIGLEYLTLGRSCQTLSGGEYQRINLSTALGSTLVDTLYVLDEPSIGMHPRDTARLLAILRRLRNLGNTIVVVEHDPDIIRQADYIIDMGPGAGTEGGNITANGPLEHVLKSRNSLTAQYLTKKKSIEINTTRRPCGKDKITITEAAEHNLRIKHCDIPLHNFVVITGVSGSGKSTLVYDILYAGGMDQQGRLPKDLSLGKFKHITGFQHLRDIDIVSQAPIGKSSRSTPATYIKVFDNIRELYAQTQGARQMGVRPGYFSFNVPGGRCEDCEGEGYTTVDMQFLPDIKIVCEACGGTRYKKDVREMTYHGKDIVEVLDMTVSQALEHFKGIDRIEKKLQVMADVGLDYLRLGQSSSTLSGGESQRIKLAAHIDAAEQTDCLYIMDEPTTGLHLDDIAKLIKAINKLLDAGNSAIVIEHNLHLIATADWVIDLGPEAGAGGGLVVGQGTPEDIAKLDTHTGRALAQFFKENECNKK